MQRYCVKHNCRVTNYMSGQNVAGLHFYRKCITFSYLLSVYVIEYIFEIYSGMIWSSFYFDFIFWVAMILHQWTLRCHISPAIPLDVQRMVRTRNKENLKPLCYFVPLLWEWWPVLVSFMLSGGCVHIMMPFIILLLLSNSHCPHKFAVFFLFFFN